MDYGLTCSLFELTMTATLSSGFLARAGLKSRLAESELDLPANFMLAVCKLWLSRAMEAALIYNTLCKIVNLYDYSTTRLSAAFGSRFAILLLFGQGSAEQMRFSIDIVGEISTLECELQAPIRIAGNRYSLQVKLHYVEVPS